MTGRKKPDIGKENSGMLSHTFAVCAYRESPYLEACIRSLKRQTVKSNIIICTSTPCAYITDMAEKYGLPIYVRTGESDIRADWNFACEKAGTKLVTVAHQDDRYHKDYAKYVQACWEKYPDTSVFTTDCLIMKNDRILKLSPVNEVKRVLRLPLRLHGLADRTWVKKSAFMFGNPAICPSCTYNTALTGLPVFRSPYKFALDWDTMWRLAGAAGRFYCVEKPLICYRVHDGSETKKCIADHRRAEDEMTMFRKIWPAPLAKLLMVFYQMAQKAYD